MTNRAGFYNKLQNNRKKSVYYVEEFTQAVNKLGK